MKYIPVIPIAFCASGLLSHAADSARPNILFVISDDQSWPYASAYGTKWVKTPGFDRVAQKGILFNNAYVTSPGSSPSRASILTGRYPWQIEEAGTHGSSFPVKYKVFTQVLEENGYLTGFTGKPWGPGDWEISGWKQNPVGKEYNQKKLKPPYSGISNVDYSGNFEVFLKDRKEGQPFFFWFGAHEPHRGFEKGSGIKEMKDEASPDVPGFLPDISIVRQDLLDYAVEIEWFDKQLVKILNKLDEIGELENTLIILTGDNGMPFPRAKANCYDAGIHVPLAICWGSKITPGQLSDDLISMVDIAPTILEAAGLKFNGGYPMTGKSFLKPLVSKKFESNNRMQEIFAGRERHSSARYDNRGYPQRIIRTDKYLFIRNYHPEYWPSGDPQVYRNDSTLGEMHQAYLDIDDSPTLAYYRKTNTKDQSFLPLFLAAVDKRPAEELYDIIKDPACMNNLAGKQEFENVRKQLSERLASRLKETGDTRLTGPDPEIWESYPRLRGDIRKFVNAQKAGISDGLVGHWEFNDLTGKDLSGNGNDAVLNANSIYSLGTGQACIQLMPEADPVKIWVNDNSPLAISRGTICFWLNAGWTDETFLSFNNDAVQLNIYRGDFMVRFNGENEFRYENEILDYDWPEYDMREWAFYGHPRAAVGDQQWHHFAVSYDDEGKRIIGWRDGKLIAVIDLSTIKTEPLRKKGLTAIKLGGSFAGFMDDIRIYNKVLTDELIQDIYNVNKSIFAGRFDTNPFKDEYQTSYKYRKEDQKLYQAWLQYDAVSNPAAKSFLMNIVAEGSNSTIQTAANELKNSAKTMLGISSRITGNPASGSNVIIGTAETSPWIKKNAKNLGIDRIKEDGFIIKTINTNNVSVLVVAARIPAGVAFGTFDLIRRIQKGNNINKIDVLENPRVPIRMINHWSFFRGFYGDIWGGGRNNSIFSWKEIADGDTKIIRDWARMMASAGWNAICPSEVNWDFRDNYLDHLDEVEKLASIFRDYGIRLYWSPSYILALDPATADSLYARVPDFGGYMMKLGSEKQNGDPRPPMVNRIADNLKPYGGMCLVRGFVYGNSRYSENEYRNLIPHDLFAPEDGNFRDNVVLVPKGSAGDWDFSAPIPAIDGGLNKTLRGSELVIDKDFPSSWVEKWKWWLEQDTYRDGPGSLNKYSIHCIMGVSMISPSATWAESPLNMVNYYGLGRLAWNPELTLDEIYSEWIQQTFGNDKQVVETIKNILFISDDAARKTYMYRGYRGIWLGFDEFLVENKTPYAINWKGIGPETPVLKKRLLDQYNPGMREIYGDPLRGEEFLSSFHFLPYDYMLSIGRTLIEDIYANPAEAIELGITTSKLWETLDGKIDKQRFDFISRTLDDFIKELKETEIKNAAAFEKHTGINRVDALAGLTKEKLEAKKVYNVRHFGAVGDGVANDAPAINKAIDACSKAGGGTVFLPSGIYASGSIHLKSNISLVLDAGAILKAMPGWMDNWEPNPNDRNLMDRAYYHWEASLIWGKNLENVRIYGPGTLDGSSLTTSSKVPDGKGDKAIALMLCKNVEIRNLNIREGGHYAILATGCTDVLVDNVNIKTRRDGIDLMQCSNVEIANCHIDAVRYQDGRPEGGDDAIKLGSDLSLGKLIPSHNITIKNCFLASGCNAIQFGSETISGFSNIRIENITIGSAGKAGISITSNDGSVIENVSCRNIIMEKTFVPIFIKLSDVARVPEGTYKRGKIDNINFENITATDCYSYVKGGEIPSVIWGKPDTPIENIHFKNISITAKGGNPVADSRISPTENDERFPADIGVLPAHAWYLRNVKNISFIDCDFTVEKSDGKPAFVINNGSYLLFDNTTLPVRSECSAKISIRGAETQNLTIQNCAGMGNRKLKSVNNTDF